LARRGGNCLTLVPWFQLKSVLYVVPSRRTGPLAGCSTVQALPSQERIREGLKSHHNQNLTIFILVVIIFTPVSRPCRLLSLIYLVLTFLGYASDLHYPLPGPCLCRRCGPWPSPQGWAPTSALFQSSPRGRSRWTSCTSKK
jgi:hypothetical protein